MQSEKLMLNWQEHHGALVSVFESLLKSNTLVDCTLAAEGQCLKAHKVVLSACSPYFQMLFREANEKHPIVFLKGMKFQEVKAIVDFIYRGEVEVCENQLANFLEIANSLHVKGLDSSGNTDVLEERIPHISAGTCAEGKITTLPSPCKRARKHHTSKEQGAALSTQVANGKSTARTDEYSSPHQPTRLEVSCTSETISNAFSMVSSSFRTESENRDVVSGVRRSSPPLWLPDVLGEKFSSGSQTIKIEPECDTYQEQQSDLINERECEDFVEETSMMESTNEWIESRPDSINDQHSGDQSYPSFSSLQVKNEDPVSDNLLVQTADQRSSQDVSSFENAGWLNSSPVSIEVQFPQGHQSFDPGEDFAYGLQRSPSVEASDSTGVAPTDSKRGRVKKHFCPVCQKAFTRSGHVDIHMRTHTGARPYECHLCKATFTQNNNLKKHVLLHTGHRPSACPICQRAFSQRRDAAHDPPDPHVGAAVHLEQRLVRPQPQAP